MPSNATDECTCRHTRDAHAAGDGKCEGSFCPCIRFHFYIDPRDLAVDFPPCEHCNHLRGSHRPDGCLVVLVTDSGATQTQCGCKEFALC